MKIGPNNPDALRVDAKSAGADRAAVVRPGASAEPVATPKEVDRVSLSGMPPRMGSDGMAIPYDEKKVEEVRRAIQEGRFPVDAKKVADSLLADTRDLINAPPKQAQP